MTTSIPYHRRRVLAAQLKEAAGVTEHLAHGPMTVPAAMLSHIPAKGEAGQMAARFLNALVEAGCPSARRVPVARRLDVANVLAELKF